MNIGVMQGRLSPPRERNSIQAFPGHAHWRKEFLYAAQAELVGIEWIWDGRNLVKPRKIHSEVNDHKVKVLSICADYYIKNPLVIDRKLLELAVFANAAHVNTVVLPTLDQPINPDLIRAVADMTDLTWHLESSLPCAELLDAMLDIDHPRVRVCYDTGNRWQPGRDQGEEIRALGPLIGSVHVKDVHRGHASMPLGTGQVDWKSVAAGLAAIDYRGNYILQCARGAPGDELYWIMKMKRTLIGLMQHEPETCI